MNIHENFSLKSYNSFGINAKSRYFATFDNVETLITLLNEYKNTPKLFLGEGSNILFTKDFEGIILKNDIKGIEIVEENTENIILNIGAGENWASFVEYCVKNGYCGIENLALIYGAVGASPIQNIGAYGVEVKDFIKEVFVLNIETKEKYWIANKNCEFGYRDSIFKKENPKKHIILQVKFIFSKIPNVKMDYGDIRKVLQEMNILDVPTPAQVYDAICKIRTSKLPNPAEIGNAGSFFKNPEIDFSHFQKLQEKFSQIPNYPTANPQKIKIPAGWLIEQAGWKGKKLGNVGVHDKQALVLVNYGEGTGKEIWTLAQEIQKSVWEKFEVKIVPEVNVV